MAQRRPARARTVSAATTHCGRAHWLACVQNYPRASSPAETQPFSPYQDSGWRCNIACDAERADPYASSCSSSAIRIFFCTGRVCARRQSCSRISCRHTSRHSPGDVQGALSDGAKENEARSRLRQRLGAVTVTHPPNGEREKGRQCIDARGTTHLQSAARQGGGGGYCQALATPSPIPPDAAAPIRYSVQCREQRQLGVCSSVAALVLPSLLPHPRHPALSIPCHPPVSAHLAHVFRVRSRVSPCNRLLLQQCRAPHIYIYRLFSLSGCP